MGRLASPLRAVCTRTHFARFWRRFQVRVASNFAAILATTTRTWTALRLGFAVIGMLNVWLCLQSFRESLCTQMLRNSSTMGSLVDLALCERRENFLQALDRKWFCKRLIYKEEDRQTDRRWA